MARESFLVGLTAPATSPRSARRCTGGRRTAGVCPVRACSSISTIRICPAGRATWCAPAATSASAVLHALAGRAVYRAAEPDRHLGAGKAGPGRSHLRLYTGREPDTIPMPTDIAEPAGAATAPK